jgi:dynein heavy chain 1
LISQVMLYSQGIVSAQQLSDKVAKLFQMCEAQMSHQSHYDFSLRALKTLLISVGGSKRKALESSETSTNDNILDTETSVLVKTACNNVLPKLVTQDVTVFASVLTQVFPGASLYQMEDEKIKEHLECICRLMHYVTGDNWLQKILQLRQVLEMRHGVMLVGPTGVGKSSALTVLLQGLEKVDGTKGEMYIIDPKAIDKSSLYGVLDGTTMEWTDGVFTSILRKIVANQKGEADRRHWIVFDGEIDPVWAENLDVLDDRQQTFDLTYWW